MKYSSIEKCEQINGTDFGVSLFTQGCPYHCKNCFNPETWDFDKGIEWSDEIENYIIKLLEPNYIKRLSILGGEPLIDRNIKPLEQLLNKVKEIYPNKKIWLYTGGNYENIIDKYYSLIKYIDYMVDGQYIDELRDITLAFRGSSNQRIIDVQKSIKENKTCIKGE